MKRVLITGANSYIGTSFEKWVTKNFEGEFEIFTLDMLDPKWRETNFEVYDSVLHVAGIAHSDNKKTSKEKEKLYKTVNTDLTIEVGKKAKESGVKQFVFMSSAIVYGTSAPLGKTKLITRETQPSPNNCYSASKWQAEKGLRLLESNDYKICILRLPMIYGNGSLGNYPILSKLAQKIFIFPKVDNIRSMLYIENLCEFVRLIINNEECGIFWPQNKEYSNTTQLVDMIANVHGKRIFTTSLFNWVLYMLRIFTGLVDKTFGSLAYDQELSKYKEEYRLVDLKQSIYKTENK